MRTLIFLLCLAPIAYADGSIAPEHPAAPLAAEQWDTAKAAHLLRRAGFGGTRSEITALAAMGLDGAVSHLVKFDRLPMGRPLELNPEGPEDPALDAYVRAQIPAALVQMRRDIEARMKAAPEEAAKYTKAQIEAYIKQQAENRALQQGARHVNDRWLFQLRSWWMARMVTTRRPLEEKLTLFWTNHFPSHYETVNRQSSVLIKQHQLFRENTTDFAALLHGIVRDPAMLRYLDNNRNTKANPNENLARELFELFSLGIGHYSEKDIKEAARALTGYTAFGRYFYYDRRQHDYGDKTVFGKTGPWIGKDVVRLTLERKRCASFISAKLARYFLGRPASPALAKSLATTLFDKGYKLRPMLAQLFRSREFYASMGKRIKSPVELTVTAVRQLGFPIEAAPLAGQLLSKMGQHLFHPPNVKGWDGGRAWINSATMLVRYNMLADLVKSGQQLDGRMELKKMYLPGHLVREGKQWTAERLLDLPLHRALNDMRSPDAALAEIIKQMDLAAPLPAEQIGKLKRVLLAEGWRPQSRKTRLQIVRVCLLISSTPQYQLN